MVAAYEASAESNAFSSKFDYYLKGQARFSGEELQGLALFRGKGRCIACRRFNSPAGWPRQGGPLFTEFTFDNLGIPRNPANPQGPAYTDKGLGGFLLTRPEYRELADANMGKHKVPTLRNVDLRPAAGGPKAYGHNGYFKSLEGIVHFYSTRDVKPRCPGSYAEAEALAAG